MVFLLAPVSRAMARMLMPSTIMPRIWTSASEEDIQVNSN
jgi:hypothetical protein